MSAFPLNGHLLLNNVPGVSGTSRRPRPCRICGECPLGQVLVSFCSCWGSRRYEVCVGIPARTEPRVANVPKTSPGVEVGELHLIPALDATDERHQ